MLVDMTTRRVLMSAVGAATVFAPTNVFAHEGTPPVPHDLWTTWTFEPGVVVLLLISATACGFGAVKMRRRAGRWEAVA